MHIKNFMESKIYLNVKTGEWKIVTRGRKCFCSKDMGAMSSQVCLNIKGKEITDF